jgi:hypothetical protein
MVFGRWSLATGFWQYDFDQQRGASGEQPEARSQ